MSDSVSAFLVALSHSSMAGSLLVLLVLLTQRTFRQFVAPQWRAALWLLVAARLIPISLPTSEVSIFNAGMWTRAAVSAISSARPRNNTEVVRGVSLPPLIDDRAGSAGDASKDIVAQNEAPVGRTVESGFEGVTLLFGLWLCGAAIFGFTIVASGLRFERQVRRMQPVLAPWLLALWRETCAEMRVRSDVRIYESDKMSRPALYGLFSPRLLLPVNFIERFSREELRFVFLHECAHLQRGDLLLNWVMTSLQILHWFNPVVWFGFSRWRNDREIACDAAAIAASGPQRKLAYGYTMLRLLETSVAHRQQPGLVGMLEHKRQLQERLRMIANFTPAPRPFTAAGLFLIFTLVGLSDAQVPVTRDDVTGYKVSQLGQKQHSTVVSLPRPSEPYVLFLIDGSAQTSDDSWNWLRATETVEQLLNGLGSTTGFRVDVFFDGSREEIGARVGADDTDAVPRTVSRLASVTPRGARNFDSAFNFTGEQGPDPTPQRIVLVMRDAPNAGGGGSVVGEDTRAQSRQAFQRAISLFPAPIPVDVVLLPAGGDDTAIAGRYWELAHYARGRLIVPARVANDPRTHLAFVVDTSGSMRNPTTGALWPAVNEVVDATLAAQPHVVGIQVLDADGRFLLGRQGTGISSWLPNTQQTRDQIRRFLNSNSRDSVSNPVPGIANAIRFLHDKNAAGMRMAVYVLGDEFIENDPGAALERLNAANPLQANGQRLVSIHAIGFPTTIRANASMGSTGTKFAALMLRVTADHNGSLVGLPDLQYESRINSKQKPEPSESELAEARNKLAAADARLKTLRAEKNEGGREPAALGKALDESASPKFPTDAIRADGKASEQRSSIPRESAQKP